MASGRTTSSAVLAKCPACHKDIHVTMALDVDLHLGDEVGDDRTVPATVTLKGCEVRHDCMPRQTRDGGGSISTLIERSSLGTPEAKAARESVSSEDAARVVERSEQLRIKGTDAQVIHSEPQAWPPAGMSEASAALRVADQQRRVKDIPQG